MTVRQGVAALSVLLIWSCSTHSPAMAQAGRRVDRSPEQLLAAFARRQGPRNEQDAASRDVTHVLSHPQDYPPADLEAFLLGLERLAVDAETSRLRGEAAFAVSLPGSRRKPHPVKGTVARLERIYRRSDDDYVQAMVVAGMADVAERREALEFLEPIAVQDPQQADFPGAASRALNSMWAMEEDGRAVLERLHVTGSVRDPKARHELAVLAGRGFRVK